MLRASQVAQWVKNLPTMQESQEDGGLTPRSGRSPGESNGNQLQYFCLGNPMEPGGLLSMGSQRLKLTEATGRAHTHTQY